VSFPFPVFAFLLSAGFHKQAARTADQNIYKSQNSSCASVVIVVRFNPILLSVAVILLALCAPAHAVTNLVINGDGSGGVANWTFYNAFPGGSWSADASGFVPYTFCTPCSESRTPNSMSQEINLLNNTVYNYRAAYLDRSPVVVINSSVIGISNGLATYDMYKIKIELRNATHGVIASYDPVLAHAESAAWLQFNYTFSGYGAGLRYIYIEQAGYDMGGWAGNYGPKFTNATAYLSDIPVSACGASINTANTFYTLNQSVSATGATCFNITAENVTLECGGYSITGDNTTAAYGIIANANNAAIWDCNVSNFGYGISSNFTSTSVANTEVASSNCNAFDLYNATGAVLSNVTVTKTGTNCSAIAITYGSNTTIENSTISGVNGIWTSDSPAITGTRAVNNSFSCPSGSKCINFGANTSGSILALNNFTGEGTYIYDQNGSNYYNYTVYGKNQGNIYADVANGTVSVTGASSSSVAGFYLGTAGAGYPYSSAHSAKISGGTDYAPLTPYLSPPYMVSISLSPPSPNMSSVLACSATAFSYANQTITLNVSWQKNGAGNSSAAYAAANSTAFVANLTLDPSATSVGDNWSCSAWASDSAGNSSANYSSNVTVAKYGDTVTLLLNGSAANFTATYGSSLTANASSTSGTHELYLDGALVGVSNYSAVLGAGFYNFTANSSGNGNYTASSSTYFANVTRATPTLALGIVSPIISGETGYVNCSAGNSQTPIYLYRDGVQVNASAAGGPISDSPVLAAGTYNYTCNSTSTANYTAAAEQSAVQSVLPYYPPTTAISPAAYANTSISNLTFNWTVTDAYRTSLYCNLTIDGAVNRGSLAVQNGTPYATTAASPLADGNHTWAVSCWDDLNNTNSTQSRTFTIDTGAPNVTATALAEPDNFYSLYDSALGVVRFNVTIADSASGTAYVEASLANSTNSSGGMPSPINLTRVAGTSVWNGTFNASGVIANLSFSQDMPVIPYNVQIFPYNYAGTAAQLSNSSRIGVLFHDLGRFQGPPGGMAACFREGTSVEGINATNMSYINDFGRVNLTQIMQVNGSAECMYNGTGFNHTAPWGGVFQTVGYINFPSVNMSTQEQASAVMSAMGNLIRMQIAQPHSFQASRIFVNTTNSSVPLNTTATVKLYNLPFSSEPSVLDDAGAPIALANVTWEQGGYEAGYFSKIGNLTITVGHFSGYNATDNVAPSAAITRPVAGYNSSSASVFVNVSANGTGSEVYGLNITITNSSGAVFNATNYIWNGSGATTNTANCSQVPTGAGSELVNCQLTVTLPAEGLYTLNVSVADYGSPSNTNSTSSAFRVDATAPAIAIQLPLANSVLSNNTTTLNFTASDSASGLDTSSCRYSLNGTWLNITSCNNMTLPAMADGVKTLTVFASDLAGNEGNTSIAFLVNTAGENKTMLNTTTNATSNETVYVTPLSPAANITLSSGATNVSLNITGYNSTTYNATLPQINVNASTSLGNVLLGIPNGTVASGSSDWNGTLQLPMVKAASLFTPTEVSGYTNTVNAVVEIGVQGYQVNLSKAVRILIPGMAGKKAGFQRGTSFREITTVCSSDSQAWADANLAAGADCKIDSSSDLVIWTRHFSMFGAYTQSTTPAPSPSGGSNNGGGSIISSPAVASAKNTSTYLVDMGAGSTCAVTITREMVSGTSQSVVTTTLENTGGSGCSMQNFTFADTIPDSFPAINEMSFNPMYSSKAGWQVTFSFPTFATGESKTLSYTASTWVGSSKVRNFTTYSMSAKKQQAATTPAAPTTPTQPTTEEASAWVPRKLPALPSEAPSATAQQPAVSQPAKTDTLLGAVLAGGAAVAVVLAIGGAYLLFFRKKRRGL